MRAFADTSNIQFQGGKPVFVPIRAPENADSGVVSASEWKVRLEDLEAAVSPRTKVILLNTPHNPIGALLPA